MKKVLHIFGLILLLSVSSSAGKGTRKEPWLFIGGGGTLGKVRKEFLKMAGREARLVVFTNDGSAKTREKEQKRWQDRGFTKLIVLHTSDRKEASSDEFVKPLEFADAVWFSGGVQQNYARAYAGTRVEKELIRLQDRGGVIGGSSAGASVQTRAMICGGQVNPRVLTGLDLLQGAIIDQHFLKRNRIPRLSMAVRQNPSLVGYGIDEGTALVVQDGKMRVVGPSYVLRLKMIEGQLQIEAFKEGDVLPMPGREDS